MKTRITSVLILAAALSASALVSLSAASKNTAALAYSVDTLFVKSSGYVIERGATRATVLFAMGEPREELAPNVWTYSRYQANLDIANAQDCNTVVITFDQNRVADLKLVNKKTVSIFAADLKVNQSLLYASAK